MTKLGQGIANAFSVPKPDKASKEILQLLKSEGTITNITDYADYFTVTYSEGCISDFSCITGDLLNSYGLYIYAIQGSNCTTLFFKYIKV